jgi:hypothetical protein
MSPANLAGSYFSQCELLSWIMEMIHGGKIGTYGSSKGHTSCMSKPSQPIHGPYKGQEFVL